MSTPSGADPYSRLVIEAKPLDRPFEPYVATVSACEKHWQWMIPTPHGVIGIVGGNKELTDLGWLLILRLSRHPISHLVTPDLLKNPREVFFRALEASAHGRLLGHAANAELVDLTNDDTSTSSDEVHEDRGTPSSHVERVLCKLDGAFCFLPEEHQGVRAHLETAWGRKRRAAATRRPRADADADLYRVAAAGGAPAIEGPGAREHGAPEKKLKAAAATSPQGVADLEDDEVTPTGGSTPPLSPGVIFTDFGATMAPEALAPPSSPAREVFCEWADGDLRTPPRAQDEADALDRAFIEAYAIDSAGGIKDPEDVAMNLGPLFEAAVDDAPVPDQVARTVSQEDDADDAGPAPLRGGNRLHDLPSVEEVARAVRPAGAPPRFRPITDLRTPDLSPSSEPGPPPTPQPASTRPESSDGSTIMPPLEERGSSPPDLPSLPDLEDPEHDDMPTFRAERYTLAMPSALRVATPAFVPARAHTVETVEDRVNRGLAAARPSRQRRRLHPHMARGSPPEPRANMFRAAGGCFAGTPPEGRMPHGPATYVRQEPRGSGARRSRNGGQRRRGRGSRQHQTRLQGVNGRPQPRRQQRNRGSRRHKSGGRGQGGSRFVRPPTMAERIRFGRQARGPRRTTMLQDLERSTEHAREGMWMKSFLAWPKELGNRRAWMWCMGRTMRVPEYPGAPRIPTAQVILGANSF